MKPTRIFATASLFFSSIALITAANISAGDEGVVRMSSLRPQEGSVPVATPDPVGSGLVPPVSEGAATVPRAATPVPQAVAPEMYPQPNSYSPYFERTLGATEVVPGAGYRPEAPFGPIMMFETNIGSGLGYDKGYQRLNARVPYHIIPNTTVLLGDVSASVTWDGMPVFSGGGIYRNYDPFRNRIFGSNAYFDYDKGYGNAEWTRATVGLESLGKYIDFRANAYIVTGSDSQLLSSTLLPDIQLMANSLYKTRVDVRDNAYSGGDIEVGGPLPLLGKYGMNMYPGAYFLTNSYGGSSVGAQVRWEALITQNLTVNTYLTHDGTFDTNAWVNLQYEIPNYRQKRTLRDRGTRERLMDPVVRAGRIHSRIDTLSNHEAQINPNTGVAWNLIHVDPNQLAVGDGSYENPFNTMQAAKVANNAGVDILRIRPRQDDTGTNLTVNGGMGLFDDQILMSSLVPLELAPDCIIPTDDLTNAPLAPLISDPVMVAGGSVIRLANNNSVLGLRIDGANAAGTVFGNAISNPLPITSVNLTGNTFSQYVNGANLQDVSGRVIVQNNIFDGLLGVSDNGLNLSVAGGSSANVLVADNTASDNSGTGLKIVAGPGSTLNADNPLGSAPTGILNNVASGNGTGISIEAKTGSTVNAIVEGNTAEQNTFDGLQMVADGSTFNLASMAQNKLNDNIGNGTFIHYLNGGTFNAVSEDANGNGTLEPGEDLNGNGRLDQGIVSNVMSNNQIAGICIFGEDASAGVFDIGGPRPSLGNMMMGNREGGLLVDLKDTATAQTDALFNTIQGGNSTPGLTIVLDFIDPAQGTVVDANGRAVGPFGLASYGFNPSQYDLVTRAIMATVEDHYRNLPTNADNPLSSIPDGEELDIDFVIGDTGTAPSNGATEYYVVTIGDSTAAPAGLAGQSADIGNIRDKNGNGPGQGLLGYPQVNGASAVGVYTNNVNQLSSLLNPPNAFGGAVNDGIRVDPNNSAPYAITALTSGNLTYTRRALGLIVSHELGHALSLRHIAGAGAVTPAGANPIMGTPAIDLPVQVLVEESRFSLNGTNPGELPGEAPFQQNDVSQLASAVGTRIAAGESKVGIRVNATDSARLLESTFNNNSLSAGEDGIAILMNNSAVAEGVTIQGNQIVGGGGNGVRLVADGANAEIYADSTIGGFGTNLYGGTSYGQGNLISRNGGDGFRAVAANGGLVYGNLLNNTITDNGGNGAALLIDNGGRMDFGTVASNRVIRGNTITGNGGAGLLTNQLTNPSTQAQLDVTVLGNTLSNNGAGGIVSRLFGANNSPPAIPALVNNNRLNLKVGGTTAADANTISGNAEVGIGVRVTGNGYANVDLKNVTVSGTTDGADPTFDGDGIGFIREGSSLLTATLSGVNSTGNAGDGLSVSTQGTDKTDPNQPFSGTANTVTATDSNFSSNGQNGASFTARGDSTLIADLTRSTFSGNAANGIQVNTSENASFGDPNVGLPPGRRSVFNGLVVNGNGNDGIQINARDASRALVEISSTPGVAGSGAHAAASTLGSTSISGNGRDGIRIDTTGGRSDILVTSNAGATTTIDGNGTSGGGNGIRWNASGDSDGTLRVTNTKISGSVRGASEDVNADGVLSAAEDLNNNGDIDIADGDGIQANFTENATATLVVGNVGQGNTIQNNQDDGIAITAAGSDLTGNPRPIINISHNTIGGSASGITAGNGGDGVSLNVFGGTALGVAPGQVDFTAPLLTFNGGVSESGAVPQFTMTNNVVTNNGARGINLLLTGASGDRRRDPTPFFFDPVRISVRDNTVEANGAEGVFYRADSDMNQSRFVYLANTGAPGDDNQNWLPTRPEFTFLNFGSVNGNTTYLSPYLNLNSVQNSLFELTGNTIRNNGRAGVTGEGVRIDVGTGAYVAADVQNNTFGGNLEADFATSSFLSAGNTFDSSDESGVDTFDFVYLDDIAQMDLRFQTNTGNQIAPSDFGAVYTNLDPLKEQWFGTLGVVQRDASFFQVDNGPNLNSPNNRFFTFGITQNIQNAFNVGGYNIRGAADPLWPNPGFTPFLP